MAKNLLNKTLKYVKIGERLPQDINCFGDKKMTGYANKSMKLTVLETIILGTLAVVVCFGVLFFLPNESHIENVTVAEEPVEVSVQEEAIASIDEFFQTVNFEQAAISNATKSDLGLTLYRQTESRAAVEWFYTRLVNDRDIALAILENADKFSIPLSLAFSLAHTESRFNPMAKHVNTNSTIDRGLFQLNSTSFPALDEADFYKADVSAYYGLSHLRYCLNVAGNEISALAMYNAGSSKVRRNSTPQSTLNYIAQIDNYREVIDANFNTEVLCYYPVDSVSDTEVAVARR